MRQLIQPSHDACLYTSPDGQYMLIFRASAAALTEGGIYETVLNGETWSEPTLLQADINSNYWETDVSVSADGKSIFLHQIDLGELEVEIFGL